MFATALKRATGFRFSDRGLVKFNWGEVSKGFGLAFELINWSEDGDWSLHVLPVFGQIYVKLPLPRRAPKEQMLDRWGFSWRWSRDDGDAVHLGWGDKTQIVHMPWSWEWCRTSVLMPDGRNWVHELRGHRLGRDEAPIGYPNEGYWSLREIKRWEKALPYHYMLRSGEKQDRTATIGVEEREWRWRWLTWLPFPRKINRAIDVTFSEEVGERSGSWKGGCIGCGYTMQGDETPEECLRRMQDERKF